MSASEYIKNLPTLGKVVLSKGESFIHNPELLNKQSLVMASLVLVLNRTAIANYSALKAKDTPDGPYRTHEAYRTTIREFLGFTGGFLVLRQLQSWIKTGFEKALKIEGTTNPNTYSMWANVKKWFKNPAAQFEPPTKGSKQHTVWRDIPAAEKIERFRPEHLFSQTPEINLKDNPNAQKFIEIIETIPFVKFESDAAKEAFIRQVLRGGPIVLASIPTVALAGVLLEKFTRDHADQVADLIGRHFGGAATKTAKANAMAGPATFSAVSAAPPISVPGAPMPPLKPQATAGLSFGRTNMPAPSISPWATPKMAPQPWANTPLG